MVAGLADLSRWPEETVVDLVADLNVVDRRALAVECVDQVECITADMNDFSYETRSREEAVHTCRSGYLIHSNQWAIRREWLGGPDRPLSEYP